MELWIRTQNRKTMFEVRGIMVRDKTIIGVNVDGNYVLGKYESEERAIEVLDEIEKTIAVSVDKEGKYEELDLHLKTLILCNMKKIYVLPKE